MPAQVATESALDRFRRSVTRRTPATRLSRALQALWWDEKGDWDRAHACVQDEDGAEAALVHAYLHRKEGDSDNAAYWYRRAGRKPARGPFAAEWAALAGALLSEPSER